MSKAMVRGTGLLSTIVLGFCVSGASAPAQQAGTDASGFPQACTFFEPGRLDYARERILPDNDEEQTYIASANRVYSLWCAQNDSTPEQRSDAADAMALAWRRLWDRDKPYNAAFHGGGSFDLLALLGVTHEIPAPMRGDPKFTSEWIRACGGACFKISPNPESQVFGRRTWWNMWLRNDLLDNLKKERAAEPVFKMLRNAKFKLVP